MPEKHAINSQEFLLLLVTEEQVRKIQILIVSQRHQQAVNTEALEVKIWISLATTSQDSSVRHMILTPKEIACPQSLRQGQRKRKNLKLLYLKKRKPKRKRRRSQRRTLILRIPQTKKILHQMIVMMNHQQRKEKEKVWLQFQSH